MISPFDIDIILSDGFDKEAFRGRSVLVTGASGRLGIYIAQTLIAADERYDLDLTLLLLARSEEKLRAQYGDLLGKKCVRVLLQDVTRPIIADCPIDYIFHTAGLASPEDFTHRPIETLWGHVQGTKNVLDLAAEKRTTRVLYVSTVEIYGSWQGDERIKEGEMGPLAHDNFRACYPEAKRLCETMLTCYRYEKGVDFLCVRLSHTLGPGIALNDGRAFAEFLSKALRGEDILLRSDGSAMRTYTDIADAVNAMFTLLIKGEESFYNVANEDNLISVRDLARLIASFTRGRSRVLFEGTPSTLAYLPYPLGVMDTSKVRALGWKPKVDVETLFRRTYESLKG